MPIRLDKRNRGPAHANFPKVGADPVLQLTQTVDQRLRSPHLRIRRPHHTSLRRFLSVMFSSSTLGERSGVQARISIRSQVSNIRGKKRTDGREFPELLCFLGCMHIRPDGYSHFLWFTAYTMGLCEGMQDLCGSRNFSGDTQHTECCQIALKPLPCCLAVLHERTDN